MMGAPETSTACETDRAAASVCPDENALVGYIEGHLSGERRSAVEDHIDDCPACSSLMGDLAEVIAPGAHDASDVDRPLTIGRYEVIEEIGAGGMGVVYAAYDPELRRKVALKLLRPDIAHITDAPAARARLLREARLLATLSHPNVVSVYDVGAMGDDIFIAVELVQGRSLDVWLAKEKPRWREVAEVYVQAARGLLAAHEAGLVHRDIKPANLLLSEDGSVRVTDFGLAVALEETASGVRHGADTSLVTQTGAVVGTPAYMAPEQYAGRGADARSDQFSFCVSLAEAFVGERPTAGATRDDLIEAATRHDRRPPPGALLDVVARGLSARAASRHENMARVALALEEALEQESERLLAAGDVVDRGRPATSSNVWAGLVAVAALAVLGYAMAKSGDRSARTLPSENLSNRSAPAPAPDDPLPETTATTDDEEITTPPSAMASPLATPSAVALPGAPRLTRRQASKAYTAAYRHYSSGDGKACLASLADGARADPQRMQAAMYMKLQAHCTMIAGDCATGRQMLSRLVGKHKPGPELEAAIDAQSLPRCRAKAPTAVNTPEFSRMSADLTKMWNEANAAAAAKDVARCKAVDNEVHAYVAKNRIVAEHALKNVAASVSHIATKCLADNTDCGAARKSFEAQQRKIYVGLMSPEELKRNLGPMFDSSFPQCKGK